MKMGFGQGRLLSTKAKAKGDGLGTSRAEVSVTTASKSPLEASHDHCRFTISFINHESEMGR